MNTELDDQLEGFDEDPPARVTRVGDSRIEITWFACNETVEIRVVAGEGQLLITGQIEPIDEVKLILTCGAAQQFWESLQRRPPPSDLFASLDDWPPRPSEEGSGG